MASPVVNEIYRQVSAQRTDLGYGGTRFIELDERTLRVSRPATGTREGGRFNTDIAYDVARDLYTVTLHRVIGPKCDTEQTLLGVGADQLGDLIRPRTGQVRP